MGRGEFLNERSEFRNSGESRTYPKAAFTLSEILITLGVIGVVSALTLANFIGNYREWQNVVKLKQTYNILNQAFFKIVEENGTLDTWPDESLYFLKQEFLKHLVIGKSCNNNWTCYVNSGGMAGAPPWDSYTMSNGAVVVFSSRIKNAYPYGCNYKSSQRGAGHYNGKCGFITVDINGKKGPNKNAQDIFFFIYYADNILPNGAPILATASWIEDFNRGCVGGGSLPACTGWVIYNENMDYLRCPKKLGWNKAKSCTD